MLGLLAAAVGGWVDQVLSRIVDVLMAIPALIFALLLLTILGTSIVNMILVIALIDSTRVFRLARAVAMNIVVMDYIEAARLRGERLPRLILREILPNAAAPLVAEFGLRFCFVFLTISALSFLGLGIQPPTADWGSMVRDNATLITFGDITPLLPAGAIALLTVAVNFVVDWMLHRASGLQGVSPWTADKPVLLDHPRPAHRGPRRRGLERDRQGRRPDAAQGRGDGPDRRVAAPASPPSASPPWASPATAAASPAARVDLRRHRARRRARERCGAACAAGASPTSRSRRRRASTRRTG